VGIDGTDRLLPRGSSIPRFGTRVVVRIGEPFELEPVSSGERRDAVHAATDAIMSAIAALVPLERRDNGGPRRPANR
jgi:hypothetical protein